MIWNSSPQTCGDVVDLAGIGLQVGDELRKVLRRERRRHDGDERRLGDARDRRDVADEIEAEIAIERDVHRIG